MDKDLLGLRDGTNNGASEELRPEQTEPQQILATKGGTDRSPHLITIQCSLEIIQPQAGPVSVIGVEGFLAWGINGCSHIARFDWLQGCALTLTATSFKIRAKLRRSIAPGTKVFAKASAAYGSKSVAPLQLSSDYVVIDDAGSFRFDVPLWATHGVLIVAPFLVLPPRQVLVEALTFTDVVRYEVKPDDCTEANRFPLSFDIQRVRVTNQSGRQISVCIVWRLSL
jgi:hypothetical protein